ncbi:DUF72 domain-containing protein [bacterium]|nr:DUF72 domain-containing protein [bacterium]
MRGKAFVGTSGYSYGHWIEVFYPRSVPQTKWLEYYSRFFNTVELNVTFYRLPSVSMFQSWRKRSPADFSFALKGSRFITHIKKLADCREPIEIFFQRVETLGEKAKVILWQLPPRFKVDIERLEKFCSLLSTNPLAVKYRHAFEFREKTWFCNEVYEILRRHGYALALADWPFILELRDKPQEVGIIKYKAPKIEVEETANFLYIRRHGAVALYASNYSDEELQRDAVYILDWLNQGKDVYIYFNNDAYGYAVRNALTLKKFLGE